MINRLRIYRSHITDPYKNLAVEKYLMDTTPVDACTLYLWQNQNTVVIGRNQNPWAECRTQLLEQEGGKLARRLSGGGAVFHDLGNLNFTFLMAKENYDLDRQLQVIENACALAGIKAVRSGRNDLLAEGQKFSGNAFYQNRTHAYHHGTLLISADMDKLQRYLNPSKAKLEAKGVASVRSRVTNLCTLAPGLGIEDMANLMGQAFATVYGGKPEAVTIPPCDLPAIQAQAEEYGSWDYLYGTPLPFSFSCESRFSWGQVQLQLQAKDGCITAVRVYTDAMDWLLEETLQRALTGCRFQIEALQQALAAAPLETQIIADLQTLLEANY